MDIPKRDDIVIVKVIQILDYGAFVELLEYKNVRGFVHISNVSSSWVKNIRNFVKLNQVRAAKVANVDFEKGQIDLSFAGVSPQRERQALTAFKQLNREEKLISLLAEEQKKKFDDVWNEVAVPLTEEFGSLYDAFEQISVGKDVSAIIPKQWIAAVKDLVEKNVVVSLKAVRGKAKFRSLSSSGLDDVNETFSEAENVKGCEVRYLGAGTYSIECNAVNFKEADKHLTKAVEAAEVKAKKLGASFEFKKEEHN